MNNKTTRHWIILLVLVLFILAITGCGGDKKPVAQAPEKGPEKVVIKLAHNLPVTNHMARGMESFAKKVEERSKGAITVQIFPSGQLYNDKSMNDAIMRGGVQMGLNSTAMWASVIPAMEIFDVPFMFPDYEKIKKALDSGVGEKLNAEMEKKGAKVLFWIDYGFVQFANNKKPITKPEDFKGMKIRSYGELPSETIKALGGAPATLSSGEVYMALQQGTIDGQTSGTTAMYDRKMYDVTKYLTVTNHAFPEFVTAINLKFWNTLSADQKKIIETAAAEVRDDIRAQTKNEDIKTLKQLQEKGMQAYIVPASELAAWQKATEPVLEVFIKRAGPLGKELVDICKKLN